MSRRFAKLVACFLVIVAASAALMAPVGMAYAANVYGNDGQKIDWDAYKEEFAQKNREAAEHGPVLADQVEADINALPSDISLSDKAEIQRIRAMMDENEYSFKLYLSQEAKDKFKQAEEQLKLEEEKAKDPIGYYIRSLTESANTPYGIFIAALAVLWEILYIVQMFMAYGTAYRKTKANGDNGVSLFGWLIAYGFAAIIPGLGIYLWSRSKKV